MHYLKIGAGFLVGFLAIDLVIEGQITPRFLLKAALSALLALGIVWAFRRRKQQDTGGQPP